MTRDRPSSDDDPPVLDLLPAVSEQIVAHAREGTPEEVCGVLGGEYGTDRSLATRVERATNAADRPRRRYAIDPADAIALIDRIEDDGDELVGFYHSHPRGPPEPSSIDHDRAYWPGYSYLIVVPEHDPVVRSWRYTGDQFVLEL